MKWKFTKPYANYVAKYGVVEALAPGNVPSGELGWIHNPAERMEYVGKLRELIALLESDACLFPEERAARDAAFNMQGVPKP